MTKSMKKRTPTQQAMSALRQRLNWTQATLAQVLGVTLPSLGRMEATEPPTGLTLARLHSFARAVGENKLATTFWRALEQEAETRPKTAALIEEVRRWSELSQAVSALATEIQKLAPSDLTSRIKDRELDLQTAYGMVRRLRWNEMEKLDQ
jgi:DNA-binding XRE family transcriptional regulator